MFLYSRDIKRFPRFDALLKDIKPWVDSKPYIKQPLLECTGNDVVFLDKILTYTGAHCTYYLDARIVILPIPIQPIITKKIINKKEVEEVGLQDWGGYYLNRDPDNFNIYSDLEIKIDEINVIRLEHTMVESMASSLAFRLAFLLLHEIGHYLRYKKEIGEWSKVRLNGNFNDYTQQQLSEMSLGEEREVYAFQQKAFGKSSGSVQGMDFFYIDSISVIHAPHFRNFNAHFARTKNNKQRFNPKEFDEYRKEWFPSWEFDWRSK